MELPDISELDEAAVLVYNHMQASPRPAWAQQHAAARGLHRISSFHPDLVAAPLAAPLKEKALNDGAPLAVMLSGADNPGSCIAC